MDEVINLINALPADNKKTAIDALQFYVDWETLVFPTAILFCAIIFLAAMATVINAYLNLEEW